MTLTKEPHLVEIISEGLFFYSDASAFSRDNFLTFSYNINGIGPIFDPAKNNVAAPIKQDP